MGYFRRYKLSDYTADECREAMRECIASMAVTEYPRALAQFAEKWACFRELLARHGGKNNSPLDEEV